MFADLLNSSYFALFLIVALGFMLGRIKIKGLSLDVSAVIFIALLFGHFGVIISVWVDVNYRMFINVMMLSTRQGARYVISYLVPCISVLWHC